MINKFGGFLPAFSKYRIAYQYLKRGSHIMDSENNVTLEPYVEYGSLQEYRNPAISNVNSRDGNNTPETNDQELIDSFAEHFVTFINQHLQSWGLTKAERQIALMIMQGMKFKDIAAARNTKIRTVRTQAATIYEKSFLESRSELTGFFLKHILGGRNWGC